MKKFAAPVLALALIVCLSAAGAQASLHVMYDNILPGLNPGDRFRLVFVTESTRDSTSTFINDYNAFVDTEAAIAGIYDPYGNDLNWSAIGSTATVDARDNIGWSPFSDALIFNLEGDLVAREQELWNATLLNPIANTPDTRVWTGTNPDGTADVFRHLGSLQPTIWGDASLIDRRWTRQFVANPYWQNQFYAMSEEITVIPEPTSLALLSLGGLLLCRGRTRPSRANAKSSP